MSETMGGAYAQRPLDPSDPLQRVERMDRDSPDRDRRQRDEFERERQRQRLATEEEDKVEISEAARMALKSVAGPPTETEPPG